MYTHHVSARCLWGSGEGVGFLANEVTDVCELPCGHWEASLGPLQGRRALLTAAPHLEQEEAVR